MLGRHHSEETKEILREKSKGNKNMLGKTHTEETKNKIREKLKGCILSEETKLNMSNGQKNRIYSDEELKKITEINKLRIGIPLSDEHKLKLSLAKLGKKQIVKCGHYKCSSKDCSHYISHKRTSECNEGCVVCDKVHKCYTIIEERKIKLENLKNVDD